MKKYAHKKIEKKWQEIWEKSAMYKTPDERKGEENFYALVEFPYSSGNLHTGHWYAFSVPDIFARFQRMRGRNVLFPVGFDAFGLPAENAAFKHGVNPRKWTYTNIGHMRRQLRSIGASFDWSREVVTADPEYYKWTQWFFLQFLKNGLAYQAETSVNWCPECKTVLANEQAIGGVCERCGHAVEWKNMKQWMLRITNYAEKLLSGLEKLDWKDDIKEAQRNWIGKSEGALIKFPLQVVNYQSRRASDGYNESGIPVSSLKYPKAAPEPQASIEIFTTRPDTLFGATYLVLSPEHRLLASGELRITNYDEVMAYIKKAKSKTELERQQEKEKTGVELKGAVAVNPATKEEISVWVADYVLSGYGTGAIMAVPAHDERDFVFAKKFNLPIRAVIAPRGGLPESNLTEAYVESGTMVNSGKFGGMDSEEAKKAITDFVGGKLTAQYKLRDWVVSRQRYWGTPIPVIHCKECGAVAVPDKDLPVELPEIKDYKPAGGGKSPLAHKKNWVNVACPQCGGGAERETDTLDTFVDSSWYFLRYCDPRNGNEFADMEKMKKWMPVNLYSGGAEHTTMHLFYSRFFMKALYDLKLVAWDEPYVIRKNRGLILGPDGQKMSKSRGNVVDPDEYVEKLGSDTVRMYLAFIGPYDEVGSYPWDPRGILGIRRFLDRVWNAMGRTSGESGVCLSETAEKLLHKTIKKVTNDIERQHYNTAIAFLMALLNRLEKEKVIPINAYSVFIQLLAPFAPHITEELWEMLGNKKSIHLSGWPSYNAGKIKENTVNLAVQVNGKLRDVVTLPVDVSQKEAEKTALLSKKVQHYLEGKKPKKIIFVPGRLINIVLL